MALSKPTRDVSKESQALRAGIGDRAWWFYLLYREMKKAGVENADDIAIEAVSEFGRIMAKDYVVNKPEDFVRALMDPLSVETFEMEFIEADDDHAVLRFHFCPLVDKWEKLGLEQEEIAKLCELARCGDHARVSNFPPLQLSFPQLIAEGDPVCDLYVSYK
jgi:hypothetical protein